MKGEVPFDRELPLVCYLRPLSPPPLYVASFVKFIS